ncbi:hypothetical protein [Chitinophaga caseinilytica]|uniref:Uncharacterized protein n=1 Tax=Chitinophaga caseinilytica TaxID=2267521 RepID=A0ABZ2Z328_9BACT
MKNTSTFLKIASLVIPAFLLVYVYWLREGISGSGGSYDLTKLYVAAAVGIWSVLYVLVMLMNKTRGQVVYLLAGGFLSGFSWMLVLKMMG